MGKKLLIVESPAKAKTIGKYLESGGFVVKSSVGHICDLPKGNGAISIRQAGDGQWTFEPTYEVSKEKKKVVSELMAAVSAADEIYLASDPDREGEAIAWHLKTVLSPVAGEKPFRRVSYNEITKNAVLAAVAEPREIDMARVDAQQARRILDRLVGYRVSPLLWKYVQCANNRTLSAGRVQSAALRLLVERQREIDAFTPEVYFLLGVEAAKRGGGGSFVARLARLDGEKPDVRRNETVNNILLDLAEAELEVTALRSQTKMRHAMPPFTTSTLQQAASSVLGFSPGKTMTLAQELYANGKITYMRTDSVAVSEQARAAAKAYVEETYGPSFYPAKPNFFKSKASAQEAHEAIRPTDVNAVPSASGLDGPALKLYDLIWRRFVASQMADAKTRLDTVSIEPRKAALAHSYLFTASATTVEFEGFLKVMKPAAGKKKADDEDAADSDEVAALPVLGEGERLDAVRWLSEEKKTRGPVPYSEASLIKALEENGVGRPSTYAATIETLKARDYAKTVKKKFVPLERGILVCDWLVKKLEGLFNVGYTAKMEAELDRIEEKGESMNAMLSAFYAKFLEALAACEEPPPDQSQADAVFALLDEVTEWKPAKKVGRRVYDDKAFVARVREQRDGGKPVSARQLEFLVRMVSLYSAQIPDAEARLKNLGVGVGSPELVQRVDGDLVAYCFSCIDRIEGLEKNPFLKSLRDQVERGRALSPKQFAILARSAGENAGSLEDCDEIRAKLAEYVPGGFESAPADPAVPELLAMMEHVTEWREPAKRGKKVYDDKVFVASLSEQYARRKSLSPRQVMALRRVVASYGDKIPDYEARAAALGLRKPASAGGKGGADGLAGERADG
jgi:DNA topoisomerase-1